MKISENPIKRVDGPAGNSGGARAGKNTAVAPNSNNGGDSVQLSPLASQMQAIDADLANSPVVDAKHVAAIKQAIADGLFKVNPDVVADHLLATARELLRSRQS